MNDIKYHGLPLQKYHEDISGSILNGRTGQEQAELFEWDYCQLAAERKIDSLLSVILEQYNSAQILIPQYQLISRLQAFLEDLGGTIDLKDCEISLSEEGVDVVFAQRKDVFLNIYYTDNCRTNEGKNNISISIDEDEPEEAYLSFWDGSVNRLLSGDIYSVVSQLKLLLQ